MKARITGIYLVTEEYGGRSHEEFADIALRAGVRTVQYREKKKTTREMIEEARRIKMIAEKHSALFIVNDRVDVAVISGAHGVHVGKDDATVSEIRRHFPRDLIVGVSVRSVEEAIEAEKEGADYVAVSPVFDTATKEDAEPGVGLSVLEEIAKAVSLPVVAIGGINAGNLALVVSSGASACAVVSAITRADDPYKSALELVQIFENARREV